MQTARPWRQAIFPSVRITRDDDFAPKHTLDKYAALAGYPDASRLLKAEPAKWIRRMLSSTCRDRRTLPRDDAPDKARLARPP